MSRPIRDLDLCRRAVGLAVLLHAGLGLVIMQGLHHAPAPESLNVFHLVALAAADTPARQPVTPQPAPAADFDTARFSRSPHVGVTQHSAPASDTTVRPLAPSVNEETHPAPLSESAPIFATPPAPTPGEIADSGAPSVEAVSPAVQHHPTTAASLQRLGASGTPAGASSSIVRDPGQANTDLPAIPLDHGVNTPPDYPASARRRGIEGEVLLEVWVDETGQATRLRIQTTSGHASLDKAALEAVARWRFRPAQRQGKAIAAVALAPVRFRLTD